MSINRKILIKGPFLEKLYLISIIKKYLLPFFLRKMQGNTHF